MCDDGYVMYEERHVVWYSHSLHTLYIYYREGLWTRCFPAMRKVQQLIDSNEIGKVVAVQADFGWSTAKNNSPEDRIFGIQSRVA